MSMRNNKLPDQFAAAKTITLEQDLAMHLFQPCSQIDETLLTFRNIIIIIIIIPLSHGTKMMKMISADAI